MAKNSNQLSYDTKSIITVLLLVLVYPIGLVVMFVWRLWPKWLRILLSIPAIIIVLFILQAISSGSIQPNSSTVPETKSVPIIPNPDYK